MFDVKPAIRDDRDQPHPILFDGATAMIRRTFVPEPASWPFAMLFSLLSCRFAPVCPCQRH
ncbi:hypothetical protein [Niveispirillum sp. KHB5.9]|uniref:hypothetical protein n=1 Tax=Niveispirillum sp. KHB5.9 TaxID=3400269 RepID=UPI003A8B6C18